MRDVAERLAAQDERALVPRVLVWLFDLRRRNPRRLVVVDLAALRDGVESPLAGNALELVRAALFEGQP
jgi:hypothetical protein